MNVFIVGSPLETAMALDAKRFNKQCIETKQILDALFGESKAWNRHPATLQYEEYKFWLQTYQSCFLAYKNRNFEGAVIYSQLADSIRPPFHTESFFAQMKRRLYTKDPIHYARWADLGTSEENWYWSPTEEKIIKYVNGKRQD